MTYRVRPEDVEWNIPGEEWRPVVGYEGLYEVSAALTGLTICDCEDER